MRPHKELFSIMTIERVMYRGRKGIRNYTKEYHEHVGTAIRKAKAKNKLQLDKVAKNKIQTTEDRLTYRQSLK